MYNSFDFHSSMINKILFSDMLTVLIPPEQEDKTPVNISRAVHSLQAEGVGPLKRYAAATCW